MYVGINKRKNRLGSFEGLGVSRTLGNQSATDKGKYLTDTANQAAKHWLEYERIKAGLPPAGAPAANGSSGGGGGGSSTGGGNTGMIVAAGCRGRSCGSFLAMRGRRKS